MFGCLRFWVLLGWLSLSCALGAASEQQEQCVEGVLYSNDLSPPPTTTVTTTSTTGQLPFLPALDMFLPFPVYYINMAQSGKRRERIERTFSPLWDLQHFPAIDGVNKTLVEELMGSENYASLKPFLYDTVQKKRMSDFDTLSNAEVGCILSHLLAIRQAYLAGHEMVMIIEDDLSPLLMPYWTSTIPDLLHEVERKDWDTIQLGWLAVKNEKIYKNRAWGPKHRLIEEEFQYGMAAYVISRRGMEAMMDMYFVDRTPNSLVKPLLEPSPRKLLLIECYFEKLQKTYVAMPALFPVDTFDATVGSGKLSRVRLVAYRLSNSKHIEATLKLFHDEVNDAD